MTKTEYQELIGFLSKKFDGIDHRFEQIDQRFDGVETRLVRVEVSLEEHRHDFKALAELVQMHGTRLNQLEAR